ncbi:hypothetical protein RFI_35474, partial [Reticulomyxa filosa]
FEIDEINGNEDIFNIRLYTLLKIDSFGHGMLELACILKYASKLESNKKMLRGKEDEDEGKEEKKENEVEKNKRNKRKRNFSQLQSEEKEKK